MKYRIGIANRGTTTDVWIFDLPGCRVAAAIPEAALELVPATIGEHLVWLKQHGEDVDPHALIEYEVIEETDKQGEFCFEADLEPLNPEELETGLRRAAYALADLTERAELPEAVLSYRPPVSAVKIENFPDARTVREIYEHGSGSHGFARNVGEAEWTAPAEVMPEAVRDAAFARLRSLSPEERSKKYIRPNARTGVDAEWSARKVIRRVINHQRFHVKEIEQRLSWLLLGVPEVIPANRE
jgi:hypothetical protein